jgi:hypothetical protein
LFWVPKSKIMALIWRSPRSSVDGDYAAKVIQTMDGERCESLRYAAAWLYPGFTDGGNGMRINTLISSKWALVLALALPTTACMAGAAAAGAGAGIYLTSRGAESIVQGSLESVSDRAKAVMAEEGITLQESDSKEDGEKLELSGKKGDLDVSIELDREDSNTTKVEVSARKNVAEWDKEYAQRVLSKIIEKS